MRSEKWVTPLVSFFIFLCVVFNKRPRWTSLRMMMLIKKKMLLWKEVRKKQNAEIITVAIFVSCLNWSLGRSSYPSQLESCLSFSSLSPRWKFSYASHSGLRQCYLFFSHRHCAHRHDRVFICFWSLYSMLGNAVLISAIRTAGMWASSYIQKNIWLLWLGSKRKNWVQLSISTWV